MPSLEPPLTPPFLFFVSTAPLHSTPSGYVGINVVPSYPLDVSGPDSIYTSPPGPSAAPPYPATTLRVQGGPAQAYGSIPYGLMVEPMVAGDTMLSVGAEVFVSPFAVKAYGGTALHERWNSNGFTWYSDNGLSFGATYTPTQRMNLSSTGLSVVGSVTATVANTSSAFYALRSGSGGMPMSITPNGAADVFHGSGMDYVSGNATARNAKATVFRQIDDSFFWYLDAGLTSGNTYSPTAVMALLRSGTSGLLQVEGELQVGDPFVTTNAYWSFGSFGDPNSVYATAKGTQVNVAINLGAKGTGGLFLTSNGQLVVQDSGGNRWFNVNTALGWASIGKAIVMSTAQPGVLGLSDIPAAITTTPTSGGYLYVSAGALKYKGAAGTVTNLAPA